MLQDKLVSLMASWRNSLANIEIGVAIKCGLRLSYDQYDGLRNLLSFQFDETKSRHGPKVDSKTGLLFQCILTLRTFFHTIRTGSMFPALPTSRRVRRWIDAQMKDLGLKDSARGSWLTVHQAIEELMSHVGIQAVNGKIYIQVVADAVRVFRRSALTTVAIRALQAGDPNYNSMTTMSVL